MNLYFVTHDYTQEYDVFVIIVARDKKEAAIRSLDILYEKYDDYKEENQKQEVLKYLENLDEDFEGDDIDLPDDITRLPYRGIEVVFVKNFIDYFGDDKILYHGEY